MNRVYITAAAAFAPSGTSIDEIFENIALATSATARIENFNSDYFPVSHGAEIRHAGNVMKTPAGTDRKSFFIEKAVGQVVEASDLSRYAPEKRHIHLGSGIDYFDVENYVNSGRASSGEWQPYCSHSHLEVLKMAEKYELRGGQSANVAACVASTQAIGLGFRIVRSDPATMVISGGYDSMLCHLHYLGFYKLGALSDWPGDPSQACRPFDKNRRGLVLGEGAVSFLLESGNNAARERILGEICGYSSTMDAYLVTDPDPGGEQLARAALEAIGEAGITPDQIDCVHLHGTGTHKNAPAEANAMKRIFSDRYKEIPVYSMKGQIGHLIGACGAMELLAVIWSLTKGQVPVTVNYDEPDPEVGLNVVRGKPLDLEIKYVLKLNAAFGGQNTAIVMRRFDA
ncbi:MAG: beta-ketoacyl-[acyl-carrier-protein] synthase family protein [Candidatus Riflebacteria bacterium]|nr:beta-ketoacyl-[acyl-carrier-protein] synthase family protein [Candidatus Riflebacteria bacterium]